MGVGESCKESIFSGHQDRDCVLGLSVRSGSLGSQMFLLGGPLFEHRSSPANQSGPRSGPANQSEGRIFPAESADERDI